MSPPTHSPVQLTLNFRSSISTKSSQFGSICLNHESILFYIIYIAILFAAQPPPRQLEGLKYLTRPGIPSQHAAWSSELLATSMFRCSAFPLFPCKTEPNKKVSIQVDYLTGRVSNQQGMAAHGILLWHFDQQAAQVWSNGHVTGTSGRPGMHCSGRRPRARSRIWRALNAWRLEMPGLGTSRSLNWRHSEARGHSNAYYDLIMAYSIIIQRSTARRKWILSPTLGAVEPMASKGHWAQGSAGGRRCSFGSFGPWRSSCRSKSEKSPKSSWYVVLSSYKYFLVKNSWSFCFWVGYVWVKIVFFCLGWECAGSKDWIFLCGMGTVELCVRVCVCLGLWASVRILSCNRHIPPALTEIRNKTSYMLRQEGTHRSSGSRQSKLDQNQGALTVTKPFLANPWSVDKEGMQDVGAAAISSWHEKRKNTDVCNINKMPLTKTKEMVALRISQVSLWVPSPVLEEIPSDHNL